MQGNGCISVVVSIFLSIHYVLIFNDQNLDLIATFSDLKSKRDSQGLVGLKVQACEDLYTSICNLVREGVNTGRWHHSMRSDE